MRLGSGTGADPGNAPGAPRWLERRSLGRRGQSLLSARRSRYRYATFRDGARLSETSTVRNRAQSTACAVGAETGCHLPVVQVAVICMSQATQQSDDDDPDEEQPRPVAQNPKRGCGHLEHGKGYIRSAPDALDLPAFVEVEPRLPYKEGHFRGFKFFPGYQFELAVMDRVDYSPRSMARQDMGRMYGVADGDHMGEMDMIRAHDLIMWSGKSYYEPDEFIEEVRKLGLSKAIPLSKNQSPPAIVPGWTRVWILHMSAIDGDRPGLLGYAPVGEVIYTEDQDGQVPKWAQDYDTTGKLTVAKVGPEVSAEATTNHALTDYPGIDVPDRGKETEARNTTLREIAESAESGGEEVAQDDATDAPDMEPVSVEPSDKPGRDVEPVSDDGDDGSGGEQ